MTEKQPLLSKKELERIRAAMKLLKITQAKLAKRIGLKPSIVSRYRDGSRAPSLTSRKRIAKVLRLPFRKPTPPEILAPEESE